MLAKFSFVNETEEKQEIRAAVTRRLALRLWPAMLDAMAKHIALNKPESAMFSDDIVQMEHASSLSQMSANGGFATPYQDEASTWPLGEVPVLLERISFHIQADEPMRLDFTTDDGKAFSVSLPADILHGFCKLLRDAIGTADWGFEVEMPGSGAKTPPAKWLN